jgi:quercetin dioxygenase-like cupin family protein
MTFRRTLVLAGIGVLGALAASAQSPAPQSGTTQRYPQFENEHVRVWKTVIMPNQPLAMHRHEFPRTIVALVGGQLKIQKDTGETQVVNWETGQAYWLEADPPNELHADVNDTGKPIEVMVVEMRRK